MKIAMTGPHALDLSALRARVDERVEHYSRKYPQLNLGEYYRWTDASHAVAQYKGGSARIELGSAHVAVELELPFFARLYKGKIEEFVRRELDAVTRSAG